MDLKKFVIDEAHYAQSQRLDFDTMLLWIVLRVLGHLNGWEPLVMISGYRDPDHHFAMQARWDNGDRAGMTSRPADDSQHLKGKAFDVKDNGDMDAYGKAAMELGARWGGTFKSPSWTHFDTRSGLRRA